MDEPQPSHVRTGGLLQESDNWMENSRSWEFSWWYPRLSENTRYPMKVVELWACVMRLVSIATNNTSTTWYKNVLLHYYYFYTAATTTKYTTNVITTEVYYYYSITAVVNAVNITVIPLQGKMLLLPKLLLFLQPVLLQLLLPLLHYHIIYYGYYCYLVLYNYCSYY